MRAGTSKAKAVGNVKILTSNTKKSIHRTSSHIGGINVILKNINDLNIKSIVVTDKNGNFETDELPAGDYIVTIEDIEQSITITEEIEELGTYTIVGEEINNFKVGLELDEEFIYADNRLYTGKIIVENVSDTTSVGVSYDVKLSDSSLEYFNKAIVLGSIVGHGKKKIPITFRFSSITKSVKNVPIEVTIKDVNGLIWTETLNIKLYKEKFYINIQANSRNVKGYIIFPFADKVIKINTQNESIILPKVAEDYKVLLSNPSITNETTYSIGVQRNAILTTDFNDPSNSEPNNNLETAKTINSGEIIESYIHLRDLDYWVIHINENFESTNYTDYTQITKNGTYIGNKFYYVNITENSYFDITTINDSFGKLSLYNNNFKEIREYDSVGIYYNGDNIFIETGEYFLKSDSDFYLYSIYFNNYSFQIIKKNAIYQKNIYYYIHVVTEGNINIITPNDSFGKITKYDINMRQLQEYDNVGEYYNGDTLHFKIGEYFLKSDSSFNLQGNIYEK